VGEELWVRQLNGILGFRKQSNGLLGETIERGNAGLPIALFDLI
jgi:hypothetical protein